MNKTMTVLEQITKIAEKICDEYCKYPEQYADEEWEKMLEDGKMPCNDCPLQELY